MSNAIALPRTKGLITNYGGRDRGDYKTEGGRVKVYPQEKGGGGAEKVLRYFLHSSMKF